MPRRGKLVVAIRNSDLVQTLLTFAFGFLFAAFIAVAVAPAIWQRAVALTRKRIEASLPLTRNELLADKDQQRAEFAMTARKLEIGIKSTRERLTLTQVRVAELEAERKQLLEERGQMTVKINGQETVLSERADQIERNATAIAALEGRRAELARSLDVSAADAEASEARINDLMIDADSRRIELATTMTEQERLLGEITEIKSARTSVEQNLRSTANQLRAAFEAQRADKRRIAELEKKSDRLAVTLSDREERLSKRENELSVLKDQVKSSEAERNDVARKYAASERQRAHLEAQKAGLSQQVTKMVSTPTDGVFAKTVKELELERTRLLETIERLTREKTSLEVAASKPVVLVSSQASSNDILRDKIHELTARVVKQTADAEGSASPIPAILGKAAARSAATSGRAQELPVSLADRIRALEHSARRN